MKTMTRALLLLCCLLLALPMLSSCSSRETKLEHSFTFEVHDKEVTITGFHGESRNFVIPARLDGKPVKTIGSRCFDPTYARVVDELDEGDNEGEKKEKLVGNLNRISRIEVPQGVEKIEAFAFGNMAGLKTIVLPKSVKEIDERAFMQDADGSLTRLDALKEIHVVKGSKAEELLKDMSAYSSLVVVD